MPQIAIVALVILGYTLLAARLDRLSVSGPMILVTIGARRRKSLDIGIPFGRRGFDGRASVTRPRVGQGSVARSGRDGRSRAAVASTRSTAVPITICGRPRSEPRSGAMDVT